jgi:DNA-binding MarR family transcriptional regulator
MATWKRFRRKPLSMNRMPRTPSGDAVTELFLEVFKLNGRLLVAGDRFVAHLGLKSARWQVLGAIALSDRPQPMAWLARSMGFNRQAVQRIVNELQNESLVAFQPNSNHRRAHFVVLTGHGKSTYDKAERLQGPWVNSLAKGISAKDIAAVTRVAAALRERLEKETGSTRRVVSIDSPDPAPKALSLPFH